ncbi:MAG: sigma-70 family RNA polymerase sigma factor [Planctomycetota bacterium]
MARVPQQADAEDIVQNTFASFVRVVGTLQIKVSLETYLFGIVRNEIVQRIRTQRAKSVCLIQDTAGEERLPHPGRLL